MINFEKYSKKIDCAPLNKTEQSCTFLVKIGSNKMVCKKYNSPIDRCREEMSYRYISGRDLIKIPRLLLVGEDFLELEFINNAGKANLTETIKAISEIYFKTMGDSCPKIYFPVQDLSLNKLRDRLSALPSELEKRNLNESKLILLGEKFAETKYFPTNHRCLVHGDLKSPHIVKSDKGIYFIDLALASISSPWYDLAFLFMEHKERRGILDKLSKISYEFVGKDLKINLDETKRYLKSGIFYRSVYDIGFAARHRSDKTLGRTIKDLKDILTGEN